MGLVYTFIVYGRDYIYNYIQNQWWYYSKFFGWIAFFIGMMIFAMMAIAGRYDEKTN